MITFLGIQMGHGMEMLWLVLVFPSDTVISMRSVFTAEIWAIIKALEQIKDSIASKYIVFTDSFFVSPSFTSYEAGTSPDWNCDTKVCLFKFCQKRHCFLLCTQP